MEMKTTAHPSFWSCGYAVVMCVFIIGAAEVFAPSRAIIWKLRPDLVARTRTGAMGEREVSYTLHTRRGLGCCLGEGTLLPNARSVAQCQSLCSADVACHGFLDYALQPHGTARLHVCSYCVHHTCGASSRDEAPGGGMQAEALAEPVEHMSFTVRRARAPGKSKAAVTATAAAAATNATATGGPCEVTPAVIKYTRDRILRATLSMHPYPHVYIRDIFQPTFYYRCMMTHIPTVEATKDLYRRSSHTGASRWQVKLSGAGSQEAFAALAERGEGGGNATAEGVDPEEWGDFWHRWAAGFVTKQMQMVWLEKFSVTTGKRALDFRKNEADYFYSAELNRDLSGYSVGPHTDGTAKWVTTLYYLPRDDSLLHQGGTLVGKFRDGRTQPGPSRWLKFDGYQVIRKAQFAPNSVLAFAPCHTSWHAVAPVRGGIARDTIQAFVSSKKKIAKEKCGTGKEK